MFKIVKQYFKGMARYPFTYMAIASYIVALFFSIPGSRVFSITTRGALIIGNLFFSIAQAGVMFSVVKGPSIRDILLVINNSAEIDSDED